MSSINSNPIVPSPIVSSPPGHGGSQLPDGPLNDPMGKVKGKGIQPPTVVTPKPGGSTGVPGAPGEGQTKPPVFVPNSDTHSELNGLFDNGSVVVAPPGKDAPANYLPDGPLKDPMGKVKGKGIKPPITVSPKPENPKVVPGGPGTGIDVLPPISKTQAIPEGGQLPKPDLGPIDKTMAMNESGQLPKLR